MYKLVRVEGHWKVTMARSKGAQSAKAMAHEDLASRIRSSADTNRAVEETLATSQRIIGRVTDGIYREPWAAFRELVANSYDADAQYVSIETDQPSFSQIVFRDDGNGMSAETVAYVVKNIGGSSKRTSIGANLNTVGEEDANRSPAGRPLIGKIGIGLFAVAQLTQHFQIITKARGEDVRTSLTVVLMTHDEDKQVLEDDGQYRAGTVSIISEKVSEGDIDSHGTEVVLYELRPEIRRTLQSLRRWQNARNGFSDAGDKLEEEPRYHIGLPAGVLSRADKGLDPKLPWDLTDEPAVKFEGLFKAVGEMSGRGTRGVTLQHFDEYLRLVWKLSLSLPIAYMDEDPFDLGDQSGILFFDLPSTSRQSRRIRLEQGRTLREQFDLSARIRQPTLSFSVSLDGMLLKRPIRLPTELEVNSRISAPVMMIAKEIAPFSGADLDLAGGPLEFEAYLYWNSRIIPRDNAGVLIRVHEASGTLFDRSFLNYQISEQTRLRQITAEIFVKQGLDSAINIDRESYNYSHPHFLYIQKWLHRALRLLVNRLKALADEDLQRERTQRRELSQRARDTHALAVWSSRQGEEADPPISVSSPGSLPSEVGEAQIEWSDEQPIDKHADRAAAIAVVLEAYGALSNLNVQERAQLIRDILKIFEDLK